MGSKTHSARSQPAHAGRATSCITGGRVPLALDAEPPPWRFSQLAQDLSVRGVIAPETLRTPVSRDDLARLDSCLPSSSSSRSSRASPPTPLSARSGCNFAGLLPHLGSGRRSASSSGRERWSHVAAKGQIRAHAVYEPRWRVGREIPATTSSLSSARLLNIYMCVVARLGYTGLAFDFIESRWSLWCS